MVHGFVARQFNMDMRRIDSPLVRGSAYGRSVTCGFT